MEIPAQTLDIMYTAVTTYDLIYFTVRALHITFTAHLILCQIGILCEQQQPNLFEFHTPYPVSGFCHPHHSRVKGSEKRCGGEDNRFDFKRKCELISVLL